MTNQLKSFFLLVLCCGLVGGLTKISAQTEVDKVLVAGKTPLRQSEVKGLIEFYEWAFETRFTDSQREQFQVYTANEYRNDVAANRKTIDYINSALPKILTADQNVQRKTREELLSELVPEMRKNTDENSRMLLGIYEAAHNGGESNVASKNSSNASMDSNTAEDSNDSNSVGNLSNLVGKWVWGRSGSTTYAASGAMMGSNGSRFTYQFSPNGVVEHTGIMNVMTGGCNMQIFKTRKGKASLNGDTLTINWSPASFTRDDSCSQSKNYTKTLPAETETIKISFKESYGQKQFCTGTGKDETCFSPTK